MDQRSCGCDLKILKIIIIRLLTEISQPSQDSLTFVSEASPRGSYMKDRHNEKCKHVALYICQKQIWLYVTSTLL